MPSLTTQAQSTGDTGAKIAGWLITAGSLIVLLGVIVWISASFSSDLTNTGEAARQALGSGYIKAGGIVALFGLHAMAVRSPRA